MQQVAMVTSPVSGQWGVDFYFVRDNTTRQDRSMPSVYLPCANYNHARKVCDAFNAGE